MEKNKNILVLSLISVVVTALAVVAVVKGATSLTPPGAPAGTMYTLEDIYNSIQGAPIWQPAESVISLPWNANNCIDPDTSANTCSDIKGDATLLLGATEFCAYLNTAGTAINCAGDPLTCAPVNYWRLPTEGELLKALSKGYLENSDGAGFQSYGYYWSSTPYADDPGNAWSANDGGGYVNAGNGSMTNQYLVRCIH